MCGDNTSSPDPARVSFWGNCSLEMDTPPEELGEIDARIVGSDQILDVEID